MTKPKPVPTIRPATPQDDTGLSVLLVSAFGQPNEWHLVQALRAQDKVAVDLLAEDPDGPVGHVCLAPLEAPEGWLALAPLCVRNEDRGRGIGTALVKQALDRARQQGFAAVVVVGDPAYYGRLGFTFSGGGDLGSPYPAQYTGLYLLRPGTPTRAQRLVYPAAFEGV